MSSDQVGIQAGPYVPRTDAGKREWFVVFARAVGNDPAAVGLTAADAAQLDLLANQFRDLLNQCKTPETRTTGIIAAKNAKRREALEVFRRYAMIIKANPEVTAGQRHNLGLHLDDPKPTRIKPPASHPTLRITDSGYLRHTLRYWDSVEPTKRAKPKGAQRLELFVEITTDGRPQGPEHARYLRSYAKQPIRIYFERKDGGKYATFYGRWATNTGEFGPWSPGVTLTIPGSGANGAADLQLAA